MLNKGVLMASTAHLILKKCNKKKKKLRTGCVQVSKTHQQLSYLLKHISFHLDESYYNCSLDTMSVEYPAYVDGKPPVLTLSQYDLASWAPSTCVDRRDGGYYIVVTEKPDTVVAKVDDNDKATLDAIFQSAHADYSNQLNEQK